MLSQVLIALAILAQPGATQTKPSKSTAAERPIDIDRITQRRICEAMSQATLWADQTARADFPFAVLADMNPRQRARAFAAMKAGKKALLDAAGDQIVEAYGINRATVIKVLTDPRVQAYRFVPEPSGRGNGDGGLRMAAGPWDWGGTRFDPGKVVIDEKIAKAIGYVNPDPNAKPEEPLPPVDPNFVNPIPGDPNGWRREVERRRRAAELEKRAAEIDKDAIRRAVN